MGQRLGGYFICSLGLLGLLELLYMVQTASLEKTGLKPQIGPDYTYYHKYQDLLREVDHVVEDNPDIMRVEVLSQTDTSDEQKYSADIKVVTVEVGGITEDHSDKIRILLNYGQHGREIITCEAALYMLDMLADMDRMRDSVGSRQNGQHIQKLLENTVFKVVPMENVSGRHKVEEGEWCLRKNGRGVDTNRNWDINFGVKEKDYDPQEEYPGKYPFSEPETRVLKRLVSEFSPHVWVNFHSGTSALFMPYDHIGSIPNGTDASKQLEIIKALNKEACESQCTVGSGGQAVGYLAHGTATDYVYEKMSVPLSFTWEIYGDSKAKYEECFKMFNPLDKETYDKVVDQWAKMVLELLLMLPQHPSIPTIDFEANRHDTGGEVASQSSQKKVNKLSRDETAGKLRTAGRKEAIGLDSKRSVEQDNEMVNGFLNDWFIVLLLIVMVVASVCAYRRQMQSKSLQKMQRKA
eukprot:TRINITY_DN1121_c0_g1_i1.p1 TRINITY_DN1121_c0_g1~~TRINITY_DN1121_c0_g1_i1.p1  ORF type:complete len:465 (-),score=42.49 TRINITY_DN1121_c0_g1_i1:548-1942(-)